MSDYHITIQDEKRKTVTVLFHIPVPGAGTNEAGLTWREAVVREQGGAANIVSELPDITSEEDAKLKSGEIYESREVVRFSSINLTNPQRKAEIETAFNERKTELIAEKQITLEWIGYQDNVA